MDQTLQPQIPGAAPPPVMTSDQIMQHVDSVYKGLPDPVKAALDHAHTLTGGDPSSNGLASVAKPSAPPPMQAGSTPSPFVPGMTGVKSSDLAPAPQTSSPASAVAPAPVGDDGIGPGAAFPAAKAAPPPISTHQAEFSRLTAPQLPSGDPNAHTKMDMGLPGSQQVHNPFLRGLATVADAIGSGLAPGVARFVPGTTAHHDFLINQQKGALGEEQAGAKSAADVAKTNAETGEIPAKTGLEQAQTAEANARAQSITNPTKALTPKDKYIAVGDGVFNAESGDWAKEPTDKKLSEVTEIDPDKGKALGLTPNKDGKFVVPNAALGELLKPPAEKTVSPEQQFIDEFRQKNPKASIADAEKAFKAIEPPQREPVEHGQEFAVPDGNGGQKLMRVMPGESIPAGAQTAAGVNATSTPTMQQRNVAGQAQLVHEQIPEVIASIDKMKDKLGPVAGRWNEFMQGKIGTDDPDFAALRADLLMASSAVALMHARGRLPENLREEFDRTINAPKQNPENLKAVLRKVDEWTVANIALGGKTPATANAPARPAGVPENAEFDPATRRWRVP